MNKQTYLTIFLNKKGESMSLTLNQSVSNNAKSVIIKPSVNTVDVLDQTQPYPGASEQYSVITTREVLALLTDMGFTYERMWEQKYRTNSVRKGFGKHALRIRHEKMIFSDLREGLIPQFYLWNSYDRTTRFKLIGGLWNSTLDMNLCWGTHFFEPLIVTHRRVDYEVLQSNIENAKHKLQKTNEIILSLQNIVLSSDQKYEYAERMARIRLGNNPNISSIKNFRQLVDTVRRDTDKGDSAWLVANRVQENLLTTRDEQISLTYSVKSKTADKAVEIVKTTRSLRSEWMKNKINLAVFDVLKDVIDNKASENKLLEVA